jgi:hypothetical protein
MLNRKRKKEEEKQKEKEDHEVMTKSSLKHLQKLKRGKK